MTILIIHYHLRAGGVTRVIESQVRVLQELGHEVTIASSGPVAGWDCQCVMIPELDYQREGGIPIADLLAIKADLWIVHNPTLGLNVAYPDLIEAAVEAGQRVLLQIHDFVEDGRPENYRLLGQRERIYPSASHVHYAGINRRDCEILRKAGVPAERCHFLPNAVNPPKIERVESGERLVFYPVRGIRRKNLGELCLLAAHAPPGVRFATALRAGSEEPAAWHDDWVAFAEENELPIDYDVVGNDPASFGGWLERASHLVTTSVSEGFGLTFLDPAFLKKPLIGRDLPEITRDFVPYGTLYQSLPVAVAELPGLEEIYRAQVSETMATYGHPVGAAELTRAWENYAEGGVVDFGNLPERFQRRVIEGPRLTWLAEWLREALDQPAQEVETTPWTLATYGRTLAATVGAVGEAGPVEWLVRERVLEQFLTPERFHFLRSRLEPGL